MSELPKIVTSRLRDAQRVGDHPDADLLAAFSEMSLSERERAQVLMHLATCSDCRDAVAVAMQPQNETVLQPMVPALRAGKPPASCFRWPNLRWGTAAACAVIVGAAVLFNTGVFKKNATPGATSDAIALRSEQDRLFELHDNSQNATARTPAPPVLTDELSRGNT